MILCFSIVTNVVQAMRDQGLQEELNLRLWEEAWSSLIPRDGSGRFVDLKAIEDLLERGVAIFVQGSEVENEVEA